MVMGCIDESVVRSFLDRQVWTFASTYTNAPHEYIVWSKIPDSEAALFDDISAFIDRNGTPERFYTKTFKYYHYGAFKYWSMKGNNGLPEILNRARI